jgi:hypothetical protein
VLNFIEIEILLVTDTFPDFDTDRLKMNWGYLLSPEPLYAVEDSFLFHWRSWCMHEQDLVKLC